MAGSFGSNVIRGAGGSGANWASAIAPFLMQLSQQFAGQSQAEWQRQQEMADYEEQLKLRQHYENEAAKDAQAIKDEQRILAERQQQQELERLFGPQQQPQAAPQNYAQMFDRGAAGMAPMAPQQPGPAPMVQGQIEPTFVADVRRYLEQWQAVTGKTPSDKVVEMAIAEAREGRGAVTDTVQISQGRKLNIKQAGEEGRANEIQPAKVAAEQALAENRRASTEKTRLDTENIRAEGPKQKRNPQEEQRLAGVKKTYESLQAELTRLSKERDDLVDKYHMAATESEQKRYRAAIDAKDSRIARSKTRAEAWIKKVNGGASASGPSAIPAAPAETVAPAPVRKLVYDPATGSLTER